MRVSIVGIGNPWAKDDGAGHAVVCQLQADGLGLSEDVSVELLTLSSVDVQLLEIMERSDVLILVDAVSSGAPPGTIHRLEWRPGLLAPRGVERASSHGLSVREILDLAAALGRLPTRVILWGIEAGPTKPGQGLSSPVASAVLSVAKGIRDDLEAG
jgi:hydrogenase maturation protease